MKNTLLLAVALICCIFISCSGDEETFDDSAIADHAFKLTSYTLSQAVDLNLDGLASIDMINEFDSLKMEQIRFTSYEKQILLNKAELSYTISSQLGTTYHCSPSNAIYFGNYQMLGNTLVEAEITPFGGPLGEIPYTARYTIDAENGKLTQTSIRNFPTTYNPLTKSWTESQIQVTKVYAKN